MAEGKIVRLNPDAGFGFIEPEGGGKGVYFRIGWVKNAPPGGLKEGMRVVFESEMGDKGPRAKSARYISESAPAAPQAESAQKQQKGYRFFNPYNFARWLHPPQAMKGDEDTELLSRCPPPPHDRWVGLNGRIVCEVMAMTPSFISDSEWYYASDGDRQEDHRTYRFYRYDFGDGPEPALPASSLRGMVRSVFETVTNSCYAHFDYDKRLSYHLPAAEALKLTPTRVERDEHGRWNLRLLTGTARLVVGSRPRDKLYAARVDLYEALEPAGRKKRGMAEKDRFEPVALNGLNHKEKGFALAENLQFPPVWNVVAVFRTEAEAWQRRKRGQAVLDGYLCINNQNIETKRYERFFFSRWKDDPTTGWKRNTTGPELVPLLDDVRIKYAELINDYQDRHAAAVKKLGEAAGKADRARKRAAFSRFVIGGPHEVQDGDLVYAMLSGTPQAPTVEFIVPVAVPRVGYKRKVSQLLPKHLWKCEEYDELCPACRVFGWVYGSEREARATLPKDKVTAYAGRVRFEHGRAIGIPETLPETTLAILSSPKPTTTRFYLKPSDNNPQPGMDDYQAGYDNRDNVIRGRKVYRHQPQPKPAEYERTRHVRDDQNRTVADALKPGAQFNFTVRFENLSGVELGALLWSLELEGNYHRLGFAKSLGFGSVRVKVSEISLVNPVDRYGDEWQTGVQRLDSEELASWLKQLTERFKAAMRRAYEQPFEELAHVRDLLTLTSDPKLNLPIHYPRPDEQPSVEGRNFEWFMGNNRNKEARYVLEMPDKERGLPLIDKTGVVKS